MYIVYIHPIYLSMCTIKYFCLIFNSFPLIINIFVYIVLIHIINVVISFIIIDIINIAWIISLLVYFDIIIFMLELQFVLNTIKFNTYVLLTLFIVITYSIFVFIQLYYQIYV